MAAFNQAGRTHPGSKTPITVTGASPVAPTDTLTLHGITRTVQEWVRRGVLRTATVSGNTTTYIVESNPESA